MRILKFVAPGVLLVGLAAGLAFVRADEAPKYSVKQVMDMAHKGGKESLYGRVRSGDASDADKKKLVDLYTALAADHPKLNDDQDWKDRTQAMLAAAKDVQAGKEGSIDALKKAAACGDCHDAHKAK